MASLSIWLLIHSASGGRQLKKIMSIATLCQETIPCYQQSQIKHNKALMQRPCLNFPPCFVCYSLLLLSTCSTQDSRVGEELAGKIQTCVQHQSFVVLALGLLPAISLKFFEKKTHRDFFQIDDIQMILLMQNL